MKPIHTWFLLVLLGSSAPTDIRSGTRDRMREIPLEVLRCDAEPAGEATLAHTWFPGHAWSIGVCAGCGTHLGWAFGPGATGDAFHGAFAAGLAQGLSFERNLARAAACGARCCTGLGGVATMLALARNRRSASSRPRSRPKPFESWKGDEHLSY